MHAIRMVRSGVRSTGCSRSRLRIVCAALRKPVGCGPTPTELAEQRPLDVELILAALDRHGVRMILIGGAAAMLHGSPSLTFDLDLVPADDSDNLNRLGRALLDLHAMPLPDVAHELPGSDADVGDFGYVAEALRRRPTWHLTSDGGLIDLVFRPAAYEGGYDSLRAGAVSYRVFGYLITVAALDQIITSKRAADRPKDHATLPVLEQLADRLAEGGIGDGPETS